MKTSCNLKIINEMKGLYLKDKKLYQNHLLKQYEIFHSRFEKEMERTSKKENVYLGINSIIMSGLVLSKEHQFFSDKFLVYIIAFIMLINLLWVISMRNSNAIKKAQLYILRELEVYLPAKPFIYERKCTQWNDIKCLKFGLIRIILPFLFMTIYIAFIINTYI